MRTHKQIQADIEERKGKMSRLRDQISDLANVEGRGFTPGEEEKLNRLESGVDKLEREIAELRDEGREVLRADFEVGRAGIDEPINFDGTRASSSGRPSSYPLTGDVRSEALRAIEQAPGATDQQRQVATVLVERDQTYTAARWAAASAAPDYLRAFAKLVQDPQRGHLEFTGGEQEAFARARHEARAMSLTDAAGGYMVPFSLDPAIMLTDDGAIDPIRDAARVVTTATDSWNGVTSAGVSTRWAAEGTEAGDDAPTLDPAPIPVHKADSFVPYSIEIEGDAIDLVAELRRIMVDAKAQHEAAAWINGTGNGQPTGIVTALDGGASEVAPTNAEAFAAADVYKLLEALPARFRDRAAWLAELSTINTLDQFETTNGSKQFPDVNAAQATLLRRRLFEVSNMDGVASIDPSATADNHVLAIGDLRAGYVIADRIGTTVELVAHLFGADRRPTGQRGLYMYWRVGADVVVPQALRLLNVSTTA